MRKRIADRHWAAAVAIIMVAAVFSVSCASTPKVSIPENSVSVVLVNKKELTSRCGLGQNQNPFLAPQNAFLGFPYEFIVLKLTTNYAKSTKIGLKADIVDEAGKSIATMQDTVALTKLWASWQLPDADSSGKGLLEKRQSYIDNYAIPGASFPAPDGMKEYYIVMKGTNPLPRPGKITVEVKAGTSEPSVFIFDLPEKAK